MPDTAAYDRPATHYWSTATDNYSPPRNYAGGTLRREIHPVTGQDTVTLYGDRLRDDTDALYILDDGDTATVWYVAGWHPRDPGIILNPIPTNPGGTLMRADHPNVRVDYRTWMLGPRRTYHLKIAGIV